MFGLGKKKAKQIDNASQKLFDSIQFIENHMEKCKKSTNNTKMKIEFNLCQMLLEKLK